MKSSIQRDRILLVDGQPQRREETTRALGEAGYAISVAASRRDALWRLRAAPPFPQAVLLDVFLPGMSGSEFRQHQQQTSQWLSVPVIVLPSEGATSRLARSIGAIGVLRWPLDPGQLLDVLSTIRSARAFPDHLSRLPDGQAQAGFEAKR